MRHRSLLFLVLALLFSALGCTAQPVDPYTDLVSGLESEFPGVSMAVGVDSSVSYSNTWTFSDDPTVTLTEQSAVFSVAKAWTAAAALRLVEQRKLNPAAPIATLLDSLPDHLSGITSLQLGLHASGIRHYASEEEAYAGPVCVSPADALPIFWNDPLLFEPGSDTGYSSWGFVLLSHVLTINTGQPFDQLMQELVFGPLNMTGVHLVNSDSEVLMYGREEGKPGWSPVNTNLSCKFGAGGFLATPTDMVRFYLGVLSGNFLSERSAQMLLGSAENGILHVQGMSQGGRAYVRVDIPGKTVVAIASPAEGPSVTRDQLSKVAEEIARTARSEQQP